MKSSSHLRVLVTLVVSFLSADTYAVCTSIVESLELQVGEANAIVVGSIESATATWSEVDPQRIDATYITEEVLKGPAHEKGFVWTEITSVGIELVPGGTYLLFIHYDNFTNRCVGSKRLRAYWAAKAKREHEEADAVNELLSEIRVLVGDNAP